jgi:hypothetical protein
MNVMSPAIRSQAKLTRIALGALLVALLSLSAVGPTFADNNNGNNSNNPPGTASGGGGGQGGQKGQSGPEGNSGP